MASDLKFGEMCHVPEVQAAKPVVSAIVRRVDPDGLLAVGDGLDEPPERGERGRLVAPVRRSPRVHHDGLVVERHRLLVMALPVLLVAHLLELLGVRAVRQRPAQLARRCRRPGLPDDVAHTGGRVPVGRRLPLVRRRGAAALYYGAAHCRAGGARVQVAEVAVQHHVARGGAHQLRGALDPLVVEDHPVQLRGHARVLRRGLHGGPRAAGAVHRLGDCPAPAVRRRWRGAGDGAVLRRRHGHGVGAAREGGCVVVHGGLLMMRRVRQRRHGRGLVDPVEGGHGCGAAAAEQSAVDAEHGAAGRRVTRLRHGDHDRGDVRGPAERFAVRRESCAWGRQGMMGSAKDGEAARARRCAGRWLLVGNQRRRVPELGWDCGNVGSTGIFKLRVLQETPLCVCVCVCVFWSREAGTVDPPVQMCKFSVSSYIFKNYFSLHPSFFVLEMCSILH
jgi:hypothetical protein